MAEVKPFRGITYDFERFRDLSSMVTPPYDVISADRQEAFYEAHPYNVIRLELGKTGPGDTDSDNRYTRAAETFNGWLQEGALVRLPRDCFYVTAHRYRTGSHERTRWGITARVRIEDEGSDVVLPHEQTFLAHKTDRFKLMRACRAQLSQVFTVYEDAEKASEAVFSHCDSIEPAVSFEAEDGSGHRMWCVSDPGMVKGIEEFFRDRTLYIADGHHRYETARNYRDFRRSEGAGEGPHEYVMMYLSSMDDEGLTILPYHRLLSAGPAPDPTSFAERASRWFAVENPGRDTAGDPAALERALAEAGKARTAFAVFTGAGSCFLLRMRPDAENHMSRDLHPALRRLDVQRLSELVFGKTLGLTVEDMGNDELFQFDSSIENCLDRVRSGEAGAAFLLNPTPMERVREVARAGLVMPGKSTYFYPKVLTGLVFNPLDDDEGA